MGLSKIILKIVLGFVNICTFWMKQDSKRITFISLTQKELSSDFKLIDEELKKDGSYDIHYNLIVFEQNIKGKFNYFLNCIQQLIEMKKSKCIILNDNNYVVSNFKPKGTKVLQIWHAPGAVKQFGNQIKRQYPIQNYDYVICNSEYWKDCFSEAFNVSKEHVIVTGLPRMDLLVDLEYRENKVNQFYKKYPQCKDKKLYLYAPTFRGNIIDGFIVDSIDFDQLDLKEDEIMLCKYHPLLKDISIHNEKVINVTHEDLYTLMFVSDLLISDYSSVIFDYALLNKPMIGFVQDFDQYKNTIGFNIDFMKEFPGPICTSEAQLNQSIHSKLNTNPSFQLKYVVYKDGKNTQRVGKLIKNIMEE